MSATDRADLFAHQSSLQVRGEIERLLAKDLLGPWADDDREVLPQGATPGERYILGVLSPRGSALSADMTDDSAKDDGTGDGADEVGSAAAAGSMSPASLGLSFRVALDTERVLVEGAWGRYEQERAQTVDDEDKSYPAWTRRPENIERELDLTVADNTVVLPGAPAGVVVRSRMRVVGQCRFVDVSLVNGQAEPKERRDAAKLFQCRLSVRALDGNAAVFLPHSDDTHAIAGDTTEIGAEGDAGPSGDPEVAGLAMLYRGSLQFAVGRNCAPVAERRDGEDRAWRLSSTSLPTFDIAQTVAPDPVSQPLLAGLKLDMRWLGTAGKSEVLSALAPLAFGYGTWLDQQALRINGDPTLGKHKRPAKANLGKARTIAKRLQMGIDLLGEDSERGRQAWQAWQFTNLVMADQRQRTEVATRRIDSLQPIGELLVLTDDPKLRSWRPFQIAFVLLNLPSLVDPTHPERSLPESDDGSGLLDLLFFPTGGGKTEAYLGLTAFTFAIRRLQGVVGTGDDARDGGAGVAVLMRYTLRLLTAQQFQRAAALVCAAEKLRRDASMTTDNPWGEEPFRIGLWVGSSVSPNWYEGAEEGVEAAKDRQGASQQGNPVQLVTCPWCALPISAKNADCDGDRRRVLLYCADPDGLCAFGKKQSAGFDEGLPVVTVDEEVYRLAPSLVIGTVDKFAQLPLNGQTALLFGRVRSRCDRHGFRHPDMADKVGCKSVHRATKDLPTSHPRDVIAPRPPDLIIQDELHLISGALGTMVGLYETVVDHLATWTVNGKQVRSKVVASTATVRRADGQVHALFARKTAVFPPPLFDAGETFFSEQIAVTDDKPGRRYVGICAHGVRVKQVQIRVAQILLGAAQTEFDKHGGIGRNPADPYMTLVDYFSSTVELAGMRRMVEDDITRRVRRLSRRGLSNRRTPLMLTELTSRINSGDIGKALASAGNEFTTALDSTAAQQHGQALAKARNEAKSSKDKKAAEAAYQAFLGQRDFTARPIDVLLATSMLQVGVDVARLGLMVVTGQPKNSAEYIQASSRVGRDSSRPGLVSVIYNWARPRDLAHFETFSHFHETAYAKVEALSVTPFADRAMDRGLAAVLVALVRHARPEFEPENGAQQVPDHKTDKDIQDLVEVIATRAGFVTGNPAVAQRARQQAASLLDLWAHRRRELDNVGLTYRKQSDKTVPLLISSATKSDEFSVGWSLREVEPEINLVINIPTPEIADSPPWSYGPPTGTTAGAADSDADSDDDDSDDEPLPTRDGLDEMGPIVGDSGPLPGGEAAL
ncbi:DISARM system helicase DrmA [Rhodococcoides fascians]|uniref:DISARM system helicase DrmA n=1 Tax=Rhodococcoides fascians TaxID=1828 RepID=UPI00278B91D3|nr:DISARM system helicase DrmA [Rhodococcus fascians]MDQ0284119.1 hypothetical protein [Rhodococcus fascians]